jgi:pyruvate dehydrogenase E2 component (dihydrolipoamide acetyltransferase)
VRELFIHKMSEHMETATIVRWLVVEGEAVEQHQVIMEVETDKVVADLEAPASGVLKGIRPGAEDGAVVPVGEPIAFIAAPDEEVPALPPLGTGAGAAFEVSPATGTPQGGQQPLPASEIRATPVARRLARELGVDIGLVVGSGPGGRIREEDVRAHAAAGAALETDEPFQWLDLTPAQRVTGQRMVASVRDAPQFALSLRVDVTRLLAWRARLTPSPSITALLVVVVARTLVDHARANATFEDGRVKAFRDVNVGVAVGTEDGLVVPVVRHADRKALLEVARELVVFRDKAHTMRFAPDDLAGGTFTLSNLGMLGIERFTPLLNPPQSAILAVGSIVKTPVVIAGDAVALRAMMELTLTVDHRVLDGLQAARFLADVKARLESAEGLE